MENTSQSPLNQPNNAEFRVLTDIVKLPSLGEFYENRKSELLVEYMTAKDEEILLSPGLLQSGRAFDELLKRKIKEKDFNPSKLLVGDQNAVLLFLRISAYGPDYNVTVIDPFNNEPFDTVVNLTLIKEKTLSILPDNNKEFSYETKDKKHTIKFKLLTSGEETTIQSKVEARSKLSGGINHILTDRMKHQIVELDGDRNALRIHSFIDTMAPYKAREIRNYINEVTPGLDLTHEFVSPSTGERFHSTFSINANFFYPQS